MNLADLPLESKVALVGLLAHMVDADGEVAEGEAIEILALGEEMNHSSLAQAIQRARSSFADRAALLQYASLIEDEARLLIRTILVDVANADGFRGRDERQFLDDLFEVWARN